MISHRERRVCKSRTTLHLQIKWTYVKQSVFFFKRSAQTMNGCASHIFSAWSEKTTKNRDVTVLAQHMTVNTHGALFQTNKNFHRWNGSGMPQCTFIMLPFIQLGATKIKLYISRFSSVLAHFSPELPVHPNKPRQKLLDHVNDWMEYKQRGSEPHVAQRVRWDAPVLFHIVCRNKIYVYIKFPYDSLNATREEANFKKALCRLFDGQHKRLQTLYNEKPPRLQEATHITSWG